MKLALIAIAVVFLWASALADLVIVIRPEPAYYSFTPDYYYVSPYPYQPIVYPAYRPYTPIMDAYWRGQGCYHYWNGGHHGHGHR